MKLKTLRLLDTLPLPPIYYDARKDYYLPDADDGWVSVTQSQVYTELLLRGYDDDCDPDADLMSEASEAVNKIQKEHHVGFVGPLAGWQKGFYRTDNGRILVTESTKLIPPAEGDWEMLRGVLTNMLGHDQLPFLYGWLKVALEALRAGQPRTGQALVLCGERDAGKNLLRMLISAIFGGRVAKPYQFMTKATPFNYELFEAAVLAVEDESGARDIRSRQAFGDAIKNITANEEQRCHRKNCDPVTLLPCWRLIISLNDEPVKMLVLPPMEKDIEDKMILFKVTKQTMPMHTDTTTARTAFRVKLRGQLPAFLHFLGEWQIPVTMRSERFGVTHYHHPDLLDALQEFAPEDSCVTSLTRLFSGLVKRSNRGLARQKICEVNSESKPRASERWTKFCPTKTVAVHCWAGCVTATRTATVMPASRGAPAGLLNRLNRRAGHLGSRKRAASG